MDVIYKKIIISNGRMFVFLTYTTNFRMLYDVYSTAGYLHY